MEEVDRVNQFRFRCGGEPIAFIRECLGEFIGSGTRDAIGRP